MNSARPNPFEIVVAKTVPYEGMGGSVSASSNTDLVAEVHLAEQHSHAERRRRRRRRLVRGIIVTLVVLVSLAATAIAGKLAYERHRMEQGLVEAREKLATGTATAFAEAAEALAGNLERTPDHPETLAVLAMVRAHQAVAGTVTLEELRQAVARAEQTEASVPATAVARGTLALVEGGSLASDFEIPDGHEGAWLVGLHALARVYDPEPLEKAREAVAEALTGDQSFVPNRRMQAVLALRAGEGEQALAELERIRADHPEDTGAAVDDALFHAVLDRELDGVVAVATELLARGDALSPRDHARALLARGLAHLHEGEREPGMRDLQAAWRDLPTWDLDARELVIEAALRAGRIGEAQGWTDELDLPEEHAKLLAAWVKLADGKVVDSLEEAAELAQDRPRVAYVQALALVEQGRHEEAKPWVERAIDAFPGRPELQVARARVQLHTNQATEGHERLQELSRTDPHAPRVWTGLAEALAATAQGDTAPKEARVEALERALKREHRPAEAAFMLGQIREAQALEQPEQALEALRLYAKAVEHGADTRRYEAALGLLQCSLGRTAEAKKTLRAAAEAEGAPPEALLQLARLVADEALARNAPVAEDDVEGWIDAAAAAGADPVAVERERARLELATATPASLARARGRLDPLVEQRPKDVATRILQVRTLRRLGDLDAARASVRTGVRRTPRKLEGRIYIEWARIEAADRKRRVAASLASKGWKKMLAEPRPPVELFTAARFAAGQKLAVDQSRGARTIARELTERVPFSARAWLVRSRIQLASDYPESACRSAAEAIELEPKLPEAHAARGACLAAVGDVAAARDAYQRSLELNEDPRSEKAYARKLARLH